MTMTTMMISQACDSRFDGDRADDDDKGGEVVPARQVRDGGKQHTHIIV